MTTILTAPYSPSYRVCCCIRAVNVRGALAGGAAWKDTQSVRKKDPEASKDVGDEPKSS